ncbi:helix-turn-helix domain-containing protein [Nonomuraea harbinensis]|uniref:Helix-turn-helix domain-containing protein n=1 Tax=Nonomuraea harbinensis TaxID=1286938 RepID=A0ABW1C675_9ACTN|nr:helix-turn-helix transcriptional regulator [Nonomuraea harbinensis]
MPEENEFYVWLAATARASGYGSDAQLAEALGLQQSTVSRWRKGTRPHITHLVKLGQLFRMSIEPMLVMSGHVPADLLGNTEPPALPTPQIVRQIQEAPLPDGVKKALLEYWDERLEEEQTRVAELIKLFGSNFGGASTADSVAGSFGLASSNLPRHFAGLMQQAVKGLRSSARRARGTAANR